MCGMAEYSFTNYFENEVLRKRPYIKKNGASVSARTPSGASRKSITDSVFGARLKSLEAKSFA